MPNSWCSRVRGERQRHRHGCADPGALVHLIQPGRCLHHPAFRRYGTGTGHRRQSGAIDGRRDCGAQRTRQSAPASLVRLPLSTLPTLQTPMRAAVSPVAGLCCRVVGGSGRLSRRSRRLSGARRRQCGAGAGPGRARERLDPAGLSVWVIDAGDEPPSAAELHAAGARPDQDVRFVLIGRGHRRKPRTVAPGLVG